MKEALRKLGSCFWKLDALPTKEGGLPLCSFSSDFVCLFCLFFGFRPRADEAPALPELGPVPQTSKAKKTKKGSAKVKAMIAQSHSSVQGTPLDSLFKRPVKVSFKDKKTSSSSSTSGESSQSSSLPTDHKLRRISKKLPGYLCRRACKEAATVLAQAAAGESL